MSPESMVLVAFSVPWLVAIASFVEVRALHHRVAGMLAEARAAGREEADAACRATAIYVDRELAKMERALAPVEKLLREAEHHYGDGADSMSVVD